MKKSFLALLFVVGFATALSAQTNERSAGVRFGYGAEATYQHPLTDNTRLEADLGFYGFTNNSFSLSVTHQWVKNIQDNFDWYAGGGVILGTYPYYDQNIDLRTKFGLGIAGQAGVQYKFDFPLLLSLDWRPSWYVIPTGNGFSYQGFALGVRYTF